MPTCSKACAVCQCIKACVFCRTVLRSVKTTILAHDYSWLTSDLFCLLCTVRTAAESAGSVTFKCSVPVGEYDGSFNEVHAILRRMREEHFQVSHQRMCSLH
jgi:hypothetical protein